ncbi:hypothetical protein LBW62_23700 [Ralstonia solanacearum]|uniref:hypothetical protein n=1 Tax=Ralstonia solanacearum TaxID=305 RepID=UPI000A44A9E5|nr:hypothetical protein [Ralstonia solanacearum]MDB0544269.1 hypothetical protein [Ralstonia solanacearum]MDB0554076.1 hypothetical protein [Ralstonia solanacearum]MDB0559179.1 hypothetical protein [Ralstonia solanacearum]
MFTFTSKFANNAVIVLDCLRDDDLQTGLAVYNNLRDLHDYSGHDCVIEHVRIADPGDLRIALERIRQRCLAGLLPILHFECHGDKVKGLEIGTQQIPFSWAALEGLLRPINVACEGNLGVVMAVCEGLYAITPLRLHRHAPFYFLLGTQDAIRQGALADQLPRFYEVLFTTGDLDRALEQVPSCRPFHAEKLLAVSVAGYIRNACMGRGKSERQEQLLTGTKWLLGGFRDDEQLRELRANLKGQMRDHLAPELLERYAAPFLGKRQCSFTFEDLLQMTLNAD